MQNTVDIWPYIPVWPCRYKISTESGTATSHEKNQFEFDTTLVGVYSKLKRTDEICQD
jgi:hypothetical protein